LGYYFKKLRLPLDSHWELQFSNPDNGHKSEENDPPTVIRKLATGLEVMQSQKMNIVSN